MTHTMHILILPLLAALSTSCDTPPADTVVPPSPVVQWLDKLEARGKDLHSLAADVVYIKANELTGDEVRTGKVDYRAVAKPEHPSARFVVDFQRLIIDNAARNVRRQFVFDGSWLVEKDHERKFFQKRQIVAPGEAFDPLDIDGPFPVPIGQKREEIMSRFDVTIIEDDNAAELAKSLGLDAPPLHLRLVPKADDANVQGRKNFQRVDLWIDRDRLVPVQVTTKEKASTTTVTLRKVVLDKADNDDAFDTTPPKAGEGWRVEISPWKK